MSKLSKEDPEDIIEDLKKRFESGKGEKQDILDLLDIVKSQQARIKELEKPKDTGSDRWNRYID